MPFIWNTKNLAIAIFVLLLTLWASCQVLYGATPLSGAWATCPADFEYARACRTPSDIYQLLPTIHKYAKLCNHVTEMGVRNVVGTWAFLAAQPTTYVGIDIKKTSEVDDMIARTKKCLTRVTFREMDSLQGTIEETDLLFIDTLHTYDQLRQELERHARNVRQFILFHDTTLFEYKDEKIYGHASSLVSKTTTQGEWPAISQFLKKHPEWTVYERLRINNGLTVLKRT